MSSWSQPFGVSTRSNQVCVEFWGDGFCNWWGCVSLLPFFSFPFCISFVGDDLRWDMLVFHFSCCLTVDVEQGFLLLLSYWCLTHGVSVELLVTMFKHGLQNVGFPLLLFQIVVFNPMSCWCWLLCLFGKKSLHKEKPLKPIKKEQQQTKPKSQPNYSSTVPYNHLLSILIRNQQLAWKPLHSSSWTSSCRHLEPVVLQDTWNCYASSGVLHLQGTSS